MVVKITLAGDMFSLNCSVKFINLLSKRYSTAVIENGRNKVNRSEPAKKPLTNSRHNAWVNPRFQSWLYMTKPMINIRVIKNGPDPINAGRNRFSNKRRSIKTENIIILV